MRTWIILPLLATAGSAWAFTYPGAECVREAGGTYDTDINGHVENLGTGIMNVVCPLVVDDPFNQGLVPIMTVFTTDVSSTTSVCCSQRVKYASGSYITGGTTCTPAGLVNTGNTSLFPVVPAATNVSSARYLFCTIPGTDPLTGDRSEIRSYVFDEF